MERDCLRFRERHCQTHNPDVPPLTMMHLAVRSLLVLHFLIGCDGKNLFSFAIGKAILIFCRRTLAVLYSFVWQDLSKLFLVLFGLLKQVSA